MAISFEPLAKSHFPLLLKSLARPRVKKWWDPDITYNMDSVRKKYGTRSRGYEIIEGESKPISCYLILFAQIPVGYIQIYSAYDFPRDEILSGLPQNLGALDIFIGEEKCLKQNLGSKAILEFLKLYGRGYTHIFVDPDPNNFAAVKCYEKAGFKKIEGRGAEGEIRMVKKVTNAKLRD